MTRIIEDNNYVPLHITKDGHPFSGAVVTIAGAGDVYSDEEMTTVITTATANGAGDAHFYAPPGTYTFTCSGADSDSLESVQILGDELGGQRAFRFVKTGTAVLVAGTKTVSDTAITANSIIVLGNKAVGGTPGGLFVSAKTADTSFVITSTSNTDTSTVQYWIVKY